MAGHSVGASEINYAQQPDGMTSATTKAYLIRVSKDWRVLLALSTELDKKFVWTHVQTSKHLNLT